MSGEKHTHHLYVTLRHEDGPKVDEETTMDYFCATLGQENGAGSAAMQLSIPVNEGEDASVWVVEMVDDRP